MACGGWRRHAIARVRARDRRRGGRTAATSARITLGLVLAFLGEPDAGEAHLRRALGRRVLRRRQDTRAYLHLAGCTDPRTTCRALDA
jgi:hypothetical protein